VTDGIIRQPEVKDMLFGERLAIVETDVKHLVKLMEAHIQAPNCDSCKLGDDVAVCKTDVKWMKRIGYTIGGSGVASAFGLLIDRLFFR